MPTPRARPASESDPRPERPLPPLSRIGAAALLVLGAAALYTARPLGWGAADAADGTRFKVSPVGLSHVLEPRQAVSPTRDCRWSPPSGDAALCAVAPGGASAFRALRLVPWIVILAALLCVAGAVLLLVRAPAMDRRARRALTVSLVAALAGPLLFARSVPRALAALQGLEFGVGGTRGVLQLCVTAAALSGMCAAMLLRAGDPANSAVRGSRPPVVMTRGIAGAALLILPAFAFLSLFPLLGGLALAAAGTATGFGAGRWLVR